MSTTGSDRGMRVAVVDDDSGHVQVLAKRMQALGWRYQVSPRPLSIEQLLSMRVGVLVLDPAIFGPAAWTFLETVCERLPGLAVIVCTGRSSVADRVRGLRSGADDWVTKPCHPEEVLARVEAVVRRGVRGEQPVPARPLAAGDVEIRADQFQAFAGGVSVGLTRREFEVVAVLAGAAGQVLQREEIYERVWGYAMARGDRSVDVFVRKLRKKFEQASPEWRYIHTHFGVGYRFAAEPASDAAAAGAPVGPRPVLDAAAADAPGGASPAGDAVGANAPGSAPPSRAVPAAVPA